MGFENRQSERPNEGLFDEGVVAGAGKLLAHGFGIVAAAERSNLNVQQFVLRFVADGWAEAVLLQRSGKGLRIGSAFYRGDLHHDRSRRRHRRSEVKQIRGCRNESAHQSRSRRS